MTQQPHDLDGIRVLLVEDSLLLAEVTCDTLESFGVVVVGPVPDVESGLKLAREAQLDGAMLDINLHGDFSFPIADVLLERNIPFVFLTGYDSRRVVPPRHQSAERLSKPVDAAGLHAAAEGFRPR